MENTLKLKIATPEKVVFENDILQVSIPTSSGEITVLPHHIPLVSVVIAGELKIKDSNGEVIMAIAGGFLEIRGNNEIIILADNAEQAEKIDIDRAQKAHVRAIKEMEEAKNRSDVDFAKLQAVVDREMNRLKVGKKYKDVK